MMTVDIINLDRHAIHRQWLVCRAVDGKIWFYDSWPYDQKEKAFAQAQEADGFVVENTAWLKDIFKP